MGKKMKRLKGSDEIKGFLGPLFAKQLGMSLSFPTKSRGIPQKVHIAAQLNVNDIIISVDQDKDAIAIQFQGEDFVAGGGYAWNDGKEVFKFRGSEDLGEKMKMLFTYIKDFAIGNIDSLPNDYITSLESIDTTLNFRNYLLSKDEDIGMLYSASIDELLKPEKRKEALVEKTLMDKFPEAYLVIKKKQLEDPNKPLFFAGYIDNLVENAKKEESTPNVYEHEAIKEIYNRVKKALI